MRLPFHPINTAITQHRCKVKLFDPHDNTTGVHVRYQARLASAIQEQSACTYAPDNAGSAVAAYKATAKPVCSPSIQPHDTGSAVGSRTQGYMTYIMLQRYRSMPNLYLTASTDA